jgi:tryptophan synthase alpha subunit
MAAAARSLTEAETASAAQPIISMGYVAAVVSTHGTAYVAQLHPRLAGNQVLLPDLPVPHAPTPGGIFRGPGGAPAEGAGVCPPV